jgi:hypothetical protein
LTRNGKGKEDKILKQSKMVRHDDVYAHVILVVGEVAMTKFCHGRAKKLAALRQLHRFP